MLKNGIDIFEYYENIWNTGNFISNFNKGIEYIIKYFCVNELNNIINSLNEQNKQKAYNFSQNVQELQKNLSKNEKNIDLMTYSNYVQKFYINVFNEEFYENITNQTIQKFNICADLIEVFKLYNALDNKLLKIQQYCRYKAVYLEDCLNNKKTIKRGGFEEFIYDPNKSYNNHSNIISKNNLNDQKLQDNNKYKAQNLINNNDNKYPQYNSNIENNNNDNQNIQYNNNQNSDNNINENYNYKNTEYDTNENVTNIIADYPDIPKDPYSLSQIYNDTNNLNIENNHLSRNINDNIIPKSNSVRIENKNNLKNQNELNSQLNNENHIISINNNNQNNINNINYSNSDISTKKLYTNKPSSKINIKESILSFDQNILFNQAKNIFFNNKNAIRSLQLKQIDNTINLLQNSIKILKKFPKQNMQGFYN